LIHVKDESCINRHEDQENEGEKGANLAVDVLPCSQVIVLFSFKGIGVQYAHDTDVKISFSE